MTKKELERIKKAYSSGLKIQIWFDGYWEDFDIRDYAMYSDPFSENRQYRIVGSDYADIAEKRIKELEQENRVFAKALDLYINWADECGIAWDNFPDMTEKWYKTVEEKGLGWIEGLTFMVMEEAKEQLRK